MHDGIGMPRPLGERLLSFAVITDTHLNQGEEDCSSPFEVNKLANGRMRHVIRDLNERDLAFVVNVGDLIHPVPAMPNLYEQAAARFYEQIAELRHDLYLTPGNHDIGDKPNDWAPAAGICDEFINLWEKHFGVQYQSFDHQDCHFIIINAQIINSGLISEAEQRDWLEGDLEANKGKRIFMHSHYPPYFSRPDEEENYDNIGEPGRSWMLDLLEKHDVEALFIGHVHNFWFNRYANTDCYLLPSTAFVRHDYSEMYRVQPGPNDEAGRNDRPKLGYFVVHVHEGGHLCEIVRTYGKVLEPESPEAPASACLVPVHPRLNTRVPFGFDMRQDWMELVEIPPTGGLDEFDRKEVRNDYPLMALWEMGIRNLRVPMRDLLAPGNAERMRMLKLHGHQFTLFSFGDPDERHRELILENQDIFSAWEIGMNWDVLERIIGGIGDIARRVEMPVYLSRLRSINELRSEAGQYYHAINQGFLADDEDQMRWLLSREELRDAIGGFVFRLTLDASPWATIGVAAELAANMGVDASVHLRMCSANPAEATTDDSGAASRIAEAMMASAAWDNVSVFADTFADIDRGYFVRNGVLDRRFNPRLGFHVLRHLNAALNTCTEDLMAGPRGGTSEAGFLTLTGGRTAYVLVTSDASGGMISVPVPEELSSGEVHLNRVNLESGVISSVPTAVTSGKVSVSFNGTQRAPALLIFEEVERDS